MDIANTPRVYHLKRTAGPWPRRKRPNAHGTFEHGLCVAKGYSRNSGLSGSFWAGLSSCECVISDRGTRRLATAAVGEEWRRREEKLPALRRERGRSGLRLPSSTQISESVSRPLPPPVARAHALRPRTVQSEMSHRFICLDPVNLLGTENFGCL